MIRCLVTDDDPQVLRLLGRLLDANGYDCRLCGSVDAAVAELGDPSLEMALIDLRLPDERSGLDLLQRVVAERPDVAVVMVSGVDDGAIAQRTLELGAYGYVLKPFRTSQLLMNLANARLRHGAERELKATRRRFSSAFHDAPIGMVMIALDGPDPGRYRDVNQAYCDLVGMSRDMLQSGTPRDLTHPDDKAIDDDWIRLILSGHDRTVSIDKRLVHARGHTIWVRVDVAAVRDDDGRLLYAINHVLDVTEQRRAHDRLAQLALHDSVTGLPNRLLLMDRLEHGLGELARTDAALAVLYVDLDRFKEVNDTLGHAVGDAFLAEMAQRMCETVRPPDTVSRIGGDEFVLVCNDLHSAADAEQVAERVIQMLSEPFMIEDAKVGVGASIGIAMTRDPGHDPDLLIAAADAAMFRAKAGGRAQYRVATGTLDAGLSHRGSQT